MASVAKMEALMRLQPQDDQPNKQGAFVHRMFADSERYLIDFASDFKAEGWEQYDTDQDAPYFGVWVNASKLITLTYAEGDWTLVVCPDAASFNATIDSCNEFYGQGYIAKALGTDGVWTTYRQDRASFGVAS